MAKSDPAGELMKNLRSGVREDHALSTSFSKYFLLPIRLCSTNYRTVVSLRACNHDADEERPTNCAITVAMSKTVIREIVPSEIAQYKHQTPSTCCSILAR